MSDRIEVSGSRSHPADAARPKTFGAVKGWIRTGREIPVLILLVIVGCLTVVPLLSVVVGSFRPNGLPLGDGWTLKHFRAIWSDSFTYRIVLNSLLFAAGSTLFALFTAGILAWLIERTNVPGRSIFRTCVLMPMATPPLLLAIGWALLMSPNIGILSSLISPSPSAGFFGGNIYSFGGMIFVQGLAYVPTSYLILAPVMRNMDPAFEEAALMSGASFFQTLRRVSLPFLVPPVISIITLLMIVGMMTFDVPAILGVRGNVRLMSVEIYDLMNPSSTLPQYGKSAALNSSIFIILAVGIFVYSKATGQKEKFSSVSGKAFRAKRFDLGAWRFVAMAVLTVYFMLAVVLPSAALLWASLTPYFSGFDPALIDDLTLDSFRNLVTDPRVRNAAVNSLIVAVATAGILTLFALAVAWVIVRSRSRWAPLLDTLAMLPIGVPHLMMGMALIFVLFSVRIVQFYGTVWTIVIAHVIVFLPVASRMMQAAILQIHRELEEAARVSGASTLKSLRRVVVPLISGTIIAVFVWVLVHSLREFSAAVMLASSKSEVLSVVLYSSWDTGKPEMAAAIAIVLSLTLGALVVTLSGLGFFKDRT